MNNLNVLAFMSQEAIGVVFLWAAIAKIRVFHSFLEGLSQAFSGRWARIVGYSVVAVELTVGMLLTFQVLTRVAAIASVSILTIFTGFLITNVARKSAVSCNCFGMGSGRIIGVPDILRNVGLLALALFGAIHQTGVAATWLADAMTGIVIDFLHHPSILLILAALAAQTLIFSFQLSRVQSGRRMPDEKRNLGVDLPIGFLVPNVLLENRLRKSETLRDLLSRAENTLVIFIGAACHDCNKLLSEIADLDSRGFESVLLVVSGRGPEDSRIQHFSNAVFEEEPTLARSFGLLRTPSSLLVDREGRVSSLVQVGSAEVARQVRAFVKTSGNFQETRPEQIRESVSTSFVSASEG